MRIEDRNQSMEQVISSKALQTMSKEQVQVGLEEGNQQWDEQAIQKQKLHQAVDVVNEFFEINHSELKFVFHDGLEQYFVQLVNSETDEIVREIPPKKLLDVFYEMQKLVGMIVDEKI